jgi:hypothetical protein
MHVVRGSNVTEKSIRLEVFTDLHVFSRSEYEQVVSVMLCLRACVFMSPPYT